VALQIELVLRAFGDDRVGRVDHRLFERAARRRKIVVRLVQEPHAAKRVERHDIRDSELALQPLRYRAGHEEVRVAHRVRRSLRGFRDCKIDDCAREFMHERQQRLLAYEVRGSCANTDDADAGQPVDDGRLILAVVTREVVNRATLRREMASGAGDVDVLAARVDAPCGCERRGMLADHGDVLFHAGVPSKGSRRTAENACGDDNPVRKARADLRDETRDTSGKRRRGRAVYRVHGGNSYREC
jgi:hypothetical protein